MSLVCLLLQANNYLNYYYSSTTKKTKKKQNTHTETTPSPHFSIMFYWADRVKAISAQCKYMWVYVFSKEPRQTAHTKVHLITMKRDL